MKLLHVLVLLILPFFWSGCSQPMGNSLLVSGSSASSDTTGIVDDDEEEDIGNLEIKADNRDLSSSLEDSDKIEISGTCNDLNRKNNRILVEVFSGEQTTALPYISNAISDQCLALSTAGGTTGNGTNVGDTCFFVTKGSGLIETEGPVTRSFPQCHNGRFGFAVRLGAELSNNSTAVGRRYKVRMKIRTQEGQISDSIWEEVTVTRKLSTPVIENATPDDTGYTCTVDMLPARFNSNIRYSLLRAQTGVNTVAAFALFSNIDSTDIRTYKTINTSTPGLASTGTDSTRIIAGTTYSYTLQSQDSTVYGGGFTYNTPLTAASTAVTCQISRPQIFMSAAPTNATTGTGPTCYLAMTRVNPSLFDGTGFVSVRWAFSQVKGWTGVGGDYSGTLPSATIPTGRVSTCTSSVCTSTQAGDGLAANVTYYYAAQEVDNTLGLSGKWSNEIECKPPSP